MSLSPLKDMCRWVAKHIVAAGLAKHCEVQVSYAIGKAEPVSVEVLSDCKALTADELSRRVKEAFSFKPADYRSPGAEESDILGYYELWLFW